MSNHVVVLCDDQKRFRDEFIGNHQGHYQIISVEDTSTLIETIDNLKELPDIILLDLFHPRDNNPDFEQRRLRAEDELTKLDEQIDRTNDAVLATWEPQGINILRSIRQKYPSNKLPVAIYTQKGMILLDDNQLREVEELDGHWLLKKKLSARTEKIRIDRIIFSDKGVKPTVVSGIGNRYRIAMAISWLIITLLASKILFDVTQFQNIVIALIAAFFSAIIAFILTPFLGSPHKEDK
jgi:CheY-like chemotaxis protein